MLRKAASAAPRLAEHLGDGLAEGLFVVRVQCTELADDEGLFECGEDGFDGGGFEKPCGLPFLDPHFAEGGTGSEAAR